MSACALRVTIASAGLALLLSACASGRPMLDDPMRPRQTVDDPPRPIVIDGRTGLELSAGEVDARLAAAQVILVGEEHANPLFHAVQGEVLGRVARLSPGTAVAIEWLPVSKTLALTGFLKSSPPASLEALRESVAWDAVWGHDFAAYAPLFELARQLQVPMFPINAEPGLARLVARGGVSGVPAERRAELPPLDSGNEPHRAWFRLRMQAASHGHAHALEGDAFERFYLAQLVWDETMARNATAIAQTHKLVVFAGLGHVEHGLGIAHRLGELSERREPASDQQLRRLVIIPIASISDAHALDAAMPEREADLYWLGPASSIAESLDASRAPSSM